MIQLRTDIKPDQETLDALSAYQSEIDSLEMFELKSKRAKDAFSGKNKIGNKAFDAVKVSLTEMCSGARRCAYCEDSVGDEVEHIHPKDLYPSMCFSWDNYLYACGNCNGPKNNKFAIFRRDTGVFHPVNPVRGQQSIEPPPGDDAMINPRTEDPLDFCMLDLSLTFKFVVISPHGTRANQKADYTFNEVLRLNEREFLRQARKTAYINYKSRLGYYLSEKLKGASQADLDMLIENLRKEAHPTVWKEMQRHYKRGLLQRFDTALHQLFTDTPEAISW